MYTSNYDKLPVTRVEGYSGYKGWEEIAAQIDERISLSSGFPFVIVIECYHGVMTNEMITSLTSFCSTPVKFINATEAMKSAEEVDTMVYPFVTDDPVFGHTSSLVMEDFFDQEKLTKLCDQGRHSGNKVICFYGPGASLLFSSGDLLIYADMPRWEIQLRFRRQQVSNLGTNNTDQPFSYQYKRAYFVDWRVCDRLKKKLLPTADFILNTTSRESPGMISGAAFMKSLEEVVRQPFRVVPFFDPGPWGGQWLKEICDLDRSAKNYAWGFDCVPEENSLLIGFDNMQFEMPAINLVFSQPSALLGEPVNAFFGAEFPIRFDFLDTMGGGNLSLQVHPLKDYIRQHFGMQYTQDESYYFLEAGTGSFVYLGLKDGIEPARMLADLDKAQNHQGSFDADRFVEKWLVRKHDHVLIPAGTVHCSGADSVVLEISATPYIFTFKLWDWGRMGLDGKPRPISLKHGSHSIQWNRTTAYTKQHLIGQVKRIAEGDGWIEERTGLHAGFFIETRRHWFSKKVLHHTGGVVNVLNLVEGREAIVESPTDNFKPFIVHYAETFIVPAGVDSYSIRPHGESEGMTCATMKAFINIDNLTDHPVN